MRPQDIPAQIIFDFRQVVDYLLVFARNPVQAIKLPPDFSWKAILGLQLGFSAATGVLRAFLNPGLLAFYNGLLFLPLSGLITTGICTLFFYYTFMFVFQSVVEFRRLYTVVVLANLAFLLSHVVTPIFFPADVIGLAATCFLLVIGFTSVFGLDRKRIQYLVGGLFSIFTAIWIVNAFQNRPGKVEIHQLATPESLDVLQKELNSKSD